MKFIKSAYVICIEPYSLVEDDRRREFVLNTLLCISVCFLLGLNSLVIHQSLLLGEKYRGISPILFTLLTLLYVSLLVLSRKGFRRIATYGLLILYLIGTSYTAWTWGFDIPSLIIGCVFIIAVSSVLISTRASMYICLGLCVSIILLASFQTAGHYPSLTWRNEEPTMHDAFYYAFIILLITFLYWLSNRQTEQALIRALFSEKTLEKERDQLELTVEERTREIRRLQMERVTDLHHRAEFGNISSGAFHDLMNPLSSIHLITSEIDNEAHEKIPEYKEYISHALNASRKMQDFLDVLRKQMRSDKDKISFNPKKEIEEVLLLLSYKIKKAGCVVTTKEEEACILFGNPIMFYQIVSNLISNSIDAYDNIQYDKHINITFGKKRDYFVLEATDHGCGITKENLTQIFESFFTTKEKTKGSGLGLASTKHIVEKEFGGSITVQSTQNTITTFTVTLPLYEKNPKINNKGMPTNNQKTSIN